MKVALIYERKEDFPFAATDVAVMNSELLAEFESCGATYFLQDLSAFANDEDFHHVRDLGGEGAQVHDIFGGQMVVCPKKSLC